MKLAPGEAVIAILHTPREKIFGILDEIDPSGVSLRGVDLSYFEDLSRAIAAGEEHLNPSDYFIPMWRVERVTRDEASAGTASLLEQFFARTGREFAEL
ncbi:MAG: hypothetical protein KF756_09515 [Acidobacteria bacterium]|nr:hypothetical protein [Acidobacteriota bacterium]